jgi:prepilin-type processing-associated H-X9-DG protein
VLTQLLVTILALSPSEFGAPPLVTAEGVPMQARADQPAPPRASKDEKKVKAARPLPPPPRTPLAEPPPIPADQPMKPLEPEAMPTSPRAVAPPQGVSADSTEATASATPAPPAAHLPWLGLSLDAGLPDGAGLSVMVMPLSWLRLHVGGLFNGLSGGVRVGVVLTVSPNVFRAVRPLLALDAGYMFAGSAKLFTNDTILTSLFGNISYLFADGHVGVELGSKNFAFVLRGGLSYIDVSFGSPTLSLAQAQLTANGLRARGFIPSLRLGFQACFL